MLLGTTSGSHGVSRDARKLLQLTKERWDSPDADTTAVSRKTNQKKGVTVEETEGENKMKEKQSKNVVGLISNTNVAAPPGLIALAWGLFLLLVFHCQ